MILALLASFTVLMLVGVPVAFAIGIASLVAILWAGDIPPYVLVDQLFAGLDSFPLLAAPYFILAGELMEKGGTSRRLVDFAGAAVGHLRGGLAMVSILASMIFAGISGSGTADVVAIGSIMIPAMVRSGYRPGLAASIQACAGSLGPIIPPSLIMIIYGSLTGASIAGMFIGAIVPGMLMGLGLMAVSYAYALRHGYGGSQPFSGHRLLMEARSASLALLVPIVILGGIIGGVFTATEAGIVAALYVLILGMFVYKEIKPRSLPGILLDTGVTSGTVMLLVGSAATWNYFLAVSQVPQALVGWITAITNDPTLALLLIVGVVVALGVYIEMLPLVVVMVPVLVPVIQSLGIDPIHFGVVFCIAMVIGEISPPIGIFIFLTMAMAKTDMAELNHFVWPYIAIMVAILLLAAIFPPIVTFLPYALGFR